MTDDGKKRLDRAVLDVKQDCKAPQARLCQPSQENQAVEAHDEASSSSGQVAQKAYHVAQDVDKAKDVDKMNKPELMIFARDILGVETRQVGSDGKKRRYRAVPDVKQDCKAAQARLCQPSQENQAVEAHDVLERDAVEMRACTTANGDPHIVIANVLAPGLVTAVARKALLDGRPEATQASDFNPAVLRALSQRDPRQRDEEIAGVELEYHASVIEWMRRTQHPTVPTVWLLQEVEPALARAVQDAGYLPVTAPWRHHGAPAMFAQCPRDWHGAHEFRWQDCGGVRAASAVHGWVHARLQVTATTQISFAIGHHSTWPPNLYAHDDLVVAAGDSVSGSIAWEQHNHECITSPGGAGIYQTYVRGLRQVDGPTLTRVSFSDHLQAVEMTVEPISSSAARSEVCLPSPICQHQ